ncbi:capZ-interacting protein, partial [Rhinophrynus dorsalis]
HLSNLQGPADIFVPLRLTHRSRISVHCGIPGSCPGKSAENRSADEAPPPSVAKLAGIFGDKVNSPRKEITPPKPTRRKPPCSLPLQKPEITHNDGEKVSPQAPQLPKIKVKSSPLIEKLQANLAFAPAALLPGGAPPKSPGLKVMASPFSSPPSTPSSPGLRSSESDEVPVSFEQPPESAHLSSYTKVRTRGSLKRRPPSRRFRKSQTEFGYEDDVDVSTTPNENGDKAEDDVFDSKEKPKRQENESGEETQKAESGPSDQSSGINKSEPEQSEDKKDICESPKEGETEETAGEKDFKNGEKDKEMGEVANDKMDTEEITKNQNDSNNSETENAKESDLSEKDGEESKSGGEDKHDAEK